MATTCPTTTAIILASVAAYEQQQQQHSFNGHFLGQPRLAGTGMSPSWILLQLRMMEVVVTTGAI